MLPLWMNLECPKGSCLAGYLNTDNFMVSSSDGGTKWGKLWRTLEWMRVAGSKWHKIDNTEEKNAKRALSHVPKRDRGKKACREAILLPLWPIQYLLQPSWCVALAPGSLEQSKTLPDINVRQLTLVDTLEWTLLVYTKLSLPLCGRKASPL